MTDKVNSFEEGCLLLENALSGSWRTFTDECI